MRRCALAVLNSARADDDPRTLFDVYHAFELKIVPRSSGVELHLLQAPDAAFVDGEMIAGVREHLFAVLRDVVYIANEIVESGRFDLREPASITNAVYCIARNSGVLEARPNADLIVCWGGHSISRDEYDYTKRVGYELGLRGLDVCTGCGPGAMKGPMKGATIGHSKQRIRDGRYIGLTEPGIVAAEPPNPIVSDLVIMPDIEKRLEAFVRLAHGIIVFPGGVGTAEEILYLLGTLLDPANHAEPLPVVFTGPASAAEYFARIDEFVALTLGPKAQGRYRIVIDDPAEAARLMVRGAARVHRHRESTGDSFRFNWNLKIPHDFQLPFEISHENIEGFEVRVAQPVHERAANLRRIFSAIVAGNIKEPGIRAVEAHGPFRIHGDAELLRPLDALLASFVAQRRMKLSGEYKPVYRIVA